MQAAPLAPASAPTSAPAPDSVSTVTTFDDGWYRSVTDFARQTAWLNGTMRLLTVALIVALALMLGYAAWRAWRAADRVAVAASAWAVAGSVLSIGLGLGLKQVFQETRPCLALPDITTVQACPGPTDYSFPSDHTTIAAALAAGLWLTNRRLGVIGGMIALLEGFSRVYLGQHYPHDVLAAFVLSSLVVLGGWTLVRSPLIRLTTLVPNLAGGVPEGAPDTQGRQGTRATREARATHPEGVAEATHDAQSPQSFQTSHSSQSREPSSTAIPTTTATTAVTTTDTAGTVAPSPTSAPSPSPSPSAESADS